VPAAAAQERRRRWRLQRAPESRPLLMSWRPGTAATVWRWAAKKIRSAAFSRLAPALVPNFITPNCLVLLTFAGTE
jgi:hypothetical protein